jgi:hypothetical protein
MFCGTRTIPDEFRDTPAIELFRMGFDTADIAAFKNVHEATVLKWITDARTTERNQVSRVFEPA